MKTRISALVALMLAAGVAVDAQGRLWAAAGRVRGVVVPAVTQAPPPATATPNADVAGEWTVTLYTRQEAIFRGAFDQSSTGKLKGYMGDEGAEYPLTGTVEGAEVKLTWTMIEVGKDLPITLTGKFERNEITGTATIGDLAKVEFAALRTAKSK